MRKRRHAVVTEDAELNMTPMMDIVFIMLIFFVVTASFLKESGVDVDRPGASTAVRQEQGNILIAITAENQVWIDRQLVDVDAVRAIVARLQAESPEGGVVIQADRNASAGLLVQVIDQARMAGAGQVSIAARIVQP